LRDDEHRLCATVAEEIDATGAIDLGGRERWLLLLRERRRRQHRRRQNGNARN
jgi:hypothetical protein